MASTRRAFLGYTALAGATVFASAAGLRGLRYPTLQFEPAATPRWGKHSVLGFRADGHGAFYQREEARQLVFRAYVPEPVVQVNGTFELKIGNVHPQAQLTIDGDGNISEERIDGLFRLVTGNSSKGTLTLRWDFPKQDHYRFTAIGDTGGDLELAWVLNRSQQVGADFVLHLGDYYYQPVDPERTTLHLEKSPLPVFSAIGNHDFHNRFGGPDPQDFIQQIGPRNSTFTLGNIQFINLDTSVDHLPVSAGKRGQLLQHIQPLASQSQLSDYVVFAHRPITDPRPAETRPSNHSVEGLQEDAWLYRQLVQRGVKRVINGHIHISTEFDDRHIHTYIAGQGLAHADIIGRRPQARILVGNVEPGIPVTYQWADLNMPFESHCNERLHRILGGDDYADQLEPLKAACIAAEG
jgi:predicted phosphodiesterase